MSGTPSGSCCSSPLYWVQFKQQWTPIPLLTATERSPGQKQSSSLTPAVLSSWHGSLWPTGTWWVSGLIWANWSTAHWLGTGSHCRSGLFLIHYTQFNQHHEHHHPSLQSWVHRGWTGDDRISNGGVHSPWWPWCWPWGSDWWHPCRWSLQQHPA